MFCSAQRLNDLGDESRLLPLWRQVSIAFLFYYCPHCLQSFFIVFKHFKLRERKGKHIGKREEGINQRQKSKSLLCEIDERFTNFQLQFYIYMEVESLEKFKGD